MSEQSQNGLVAVAPGALPVPTHRSLLSSLERFGEAMQIASSIARSELVPAQFRNKPADVVIAWELGGELGLSPMQALRYVAVINGRAAVWGDALPAIVMRHPLYVEHHEELSPDGTRARCTVVRRGFSKPVVREFSMADAQKAGLANKKGPWTDYPKRMLQMRARAFALRDAFPDALLGVHVAEEVIDAGEPLDVRSTVRLVPGSGIGAVLEAIDAAQSEAELAPVYAWAASASEEDKKQVKADLVRKVNSFRTPAEGTHSAKRQSKRAAATVDELPPLDSSLAPSSSEPAAEPPHNPETGEVSNVDGDGLPIADKAGF